MYGTRGFVVHGRLYKFLAKTFGKTPSTCPVIFEHIAGTPKTNWCLETTLHADARQSHNRRHRAEKQGSGYVCQNGARLPDSSACIHSERRCPHELLPKYVMSACHRGSRCSPFAESCRSFLRFQPENLFFSFGSAGKFLRVFAPVHAARRSRSLRHCPQGIIVWAFCCFLRLLFSSVLQV